VSEPKDETLALLGLSLCKGVGSRSIQALVCHFGSARGALRASAAELAEVEGISRAVAEAIYRGPAEGEVQRELDLMERYRVRLVPHSSPDYPRPLTYLDVDAPALLRIRGEYRREDQLAMALVGSRRCTAYGREQASRIAADLSGMGFTVVSGMAQGIDSFAHRGAMQAGGRTIAVHGCGLARALSGIDGSFAAQISEAGALISELPMDAPPRPGNFPPRNRLISGLSLGVVIVEAAARSGSLITARLAAEQGRAVFAVPGNVNSPTSRGAHRLIRDGATLVESARDIVEGLGPLSDPIELTATPADKPVTEVRDARIMALSERQKQVYAMLNATPRHIDEIVEESRLAPSIISSALLTLEVHGLVRQLPGQRYARL
jgi:DNA processing protein